jgi:hypothetical protein
MVIESQNCASARRDASPDLSASCDSVPASSVARCKQPSHVARGTRDRLGMSETSTITAGATADAATSDDFRPVADYGLLADCHSAARGSAEPNRAKQLRSRTVIP